MEATGNEARNNLVYLKGRPLKVELEIESLATNIMIYGPQISQFARHYVKEAIPFFIR